MERKEYTYKEKKDTRSGFGDGLYEIGKKNKNVVALCADLTGSLKMNQFKNDFEERFLSIFNADLLFKNIMKISFLDKTLSKFSAIKKEEISPWYKGGDFAIYKINSLI